MTRSSSGVATSQSYCVVVADATRARVLVLELAQAETRARTETGADDETGGEPELAGELVEIAEITNPAVRARAGDAAAGRGGPRGAGLHSAPAYRDRRDAIERHFAAEVAEEAAAVWTAHAPCALILAAPAPTLGALRAAVAERLGGPIEPTAVHELARDLTRVGGARLRNELAGAELLPVRGHHAPVQPASGSWR